MIEYAGDENLPFKTKKHDIESYCTFFSSQSLLRFPSHLRISWSRWRKNRLPKRRSAQMCPSHPSWIQNSSENGGQKRRGSHRDKAKRRKKPSRKSRWAVANVDVMMLMVLMDNLCAFHHDAWKKTLESMSIEQQKYDAWSVFVWVLPLKCCLLFTIHSWTPVFFCGLEGYVGISIIPMAAHRCIMDLSPARNAQIAGSFVLSLPWKKRQFRVILPTKHHWLSRCRSDGFLDHHQWWFVIFYLGGGFKDFLFSPPKLGKIPNLTNIFQLGWNHQLVM